MMAAGYLSLIGLEDFLPYLGGLVYIFLGLGESASAVGFGDRRLSTGNTATEPKTIQRLLNRHSPKAPSKRTVDSCKKLILLFSFEAQTNSTSSSSCSAVNLRGRPVRLPTVASGARIAVWTWSNEKPVVAQIWVLVRWASKKRVRTRIRWSTVSCFVPVEPRGRAMLILMVVCWKMPTAKKKQWCGHCLGNSVAGWNRMEDIASW